MTLSSLGLQEMSKGIDIAVTLMSPEVNLDVKMITIKFSTRWNNNWKCRFNLLTMGTPESAYLLSQNPKILEGIYELVLEATNYCRKCHLCWR